MMAQQKRKAKPKPKVKTDSDGRVVHVTADSAVDALFVLHADLPRLLRAIRRSELGQFALYFARCNMPAYRVRLVDALKTRTSRPVVDVSLAGLPLHEQTLDDVLLSRLHDAPADAVLFVYDLDTLLPHRQPKQQQAVLLQLNWRRSAFARLQRTLVFWLPEHALQLLHNQAPDFADWYSGIYEFDVPDEAKQEALHASLQGFYDGNVHAAERLNANEKQRWIEVLHNLLEDDPSPEERAKLLNDLGRINSSTSQYDAALEAYDNAHRLSRKNGQKKLESETLNNIARIYYVRGDLEGALKNLKQALAIQKEIGDKSGEGATCNNISQIYDVRGDTENALKYLQQSLAIIQEIGDKSGEGTALNNISQIFRARGDTETALKYLQQSLAIQKEIGDKSGEGTTLNNLAGIFRARGDTETALKYLQQSLAIQLEIGNKSGEGTTLNNISSIFRARGDLEAALKYLQQSLVIRQEIGDKSGLCVTQFNIGHIYWENGQAQQALQTWLDVYRLAKKIQLAEVLQALEELADALQLPGSGLKAWEKLEREQGATAEDAETHAAEINDSDTR